MGAPPPSLWVLGKKRNTLLALAEAGKARPAKPERKSLHDLDVVFWPPTATLLGRQRSQTAELPPPAPPLVLAAPSRSSAARTPPPAESGTARRAACRESACRTTP